MPMKHKHTHSLSASRQARFALRVSWLVALAVACFLVKPSVARAERLGDIADVIGARDNQLIGYGVVTGLDGTGDDIRSQIAEQTMRSLMRRLGVQVDSNRLRLRNVAAVIVTATIPPFSRNGQRLDVTVSSIGNARSIGGGVLIQTPLRGADRRTYAVAQGPLVVGGFAASGRSGTSLQVNSTTTGRIPAGALVEREIPTTLLTLPEPPPDQATADGKKPAAKKDDKSKDAQGKDAKKDERKFLTYSLRIPDFVTAQRVAIAVNDAMGSTVAEALDGGAIRITVPDEFKENPVPLVARLSDVQVDPNQPARVVINERTGTVVAGGDVRLAPAAVAQGGVSVAILEQFDVSQPNPFAYRTGETRVTPRTDVSADEREGRLRFVDGAATLSDVATALSALGVTPRELSSVLQALRTAGALRAELVIQ